MVTGGKIGEILGRKRTFAIGSIIYACGSRHGSKLRCDRSDPGAREQQRPAHYLRPRSEVQQCQQENEAGEQRHEADADDTAR
jgi:hypothetical protein